MLELLRLLDYRLSFFFILPFYVQETSILSQLKQMSKVITKYLFLVNSLTSCLIPTLQTSAAEQKSIFVVQPLGKNNRILILTYLEFLKSVSSNLTDSTVVPVCVPQISGTETDLFLQVNLFLRPQTKTKFSTTGTHRTLSMAAVN